MRGLLTLGVALPAGAAGLVAFRRRDPVPTPVTMAAAPTATGSPRATVPAATPAPAAPSPTPPPAPTATPTPPPPATVEFRPAAIGNGETALLVVRATERRGQVRFQGRDIPLRADADLLWALVGVPVEAEPGPRTAEVTLLDAAGRTSQHVTAVPAVVAVTRPVDYLVVTEEIQAILTPQAGVTEEQLRAKEFAAFDAAPRWSRPFIQPAPGDVSTQFGSGRSVNGGPVGGFHSGADIANDHGTPVVAAAPGRVAFVEAHPIRGLSVILDHGAGVKSGYHHLDAALVTPDDLVEEGTPIARMGTSGYSTGPHLHWEITVYGVNVDPFTWTKGRFRP